jgi:hypothetical protein
MVASCGDRSPYACALFGLGGAGADYACTPPEQYLARDYHDIVVSRVHYGVLDARTTVRALPTGIVYEKQRDNRERGSVSACDCVWAYVSLGCT